MWGKPDLNLADTLVDPNYKPEWIHTDKMGPKLIKHEIQHFRSIFPDLKHKIIEIKGESDKVWVRYKVIGTHKGESWGFQPTNKMVEFEVAAIFYTSKGKVIDLWESFCFYDVFAKLGALPPFWELHKYLLDYPPK
jgi:predicted ester cyclase